MTNFDNAVRQALSKEDADFLARLDAQDQSPLHEALGTFGGKWGAINVFAAIMTFAIFGVFCYSVLQFFQASEVRDQIFWAAASLWAALAVAMLKMYFWMEMNKNTVLREVKRLELQVARLSTRDA